MMIFAKALCPGYVLDIVWMERKRREALTEYSKKKSIITLQGIITCTRGYQKKKKTFIKRRFS